MRLKIGGALLLLAAAFVFHAQDRPGRPAWQAAMYAAREAMHDPSDPLERVIAGEWQSSGPHSGDARQNINTVLAPERDPASVQWQSHRDWFDFDARGLKGPERSIFYVRRSITSPSPRTVTAAIGVRGVSAVWLNGVELFRGDITRRQPVPGQLTLDLKQGANHLLIKLWEGRGMPHFSFGLLRPPEADLRRNAAFDSLWERLRAEYPDRRVHREMKREDRDNIWREDWPKGDVAVLAARYAKAVRGSRSRDAALLAAKAARPADLDALRAIYNRVRNLDEIRETLAAVDPEAVNLAVADLAKSFGRRYPKAAAYRQELAKLEKPFLEARAAKDNDEALERLGDRVRAYQALSREALLANPMLDFDKILVVRRNFGDRARRVIGKPLGLPVGNSWTNEDITKTGWDNQIAVLSDLRGAGKLTPFYRPPATRVVTDVKLDYDASRVMFTSIGSSDRFRLFDIKIDGTGLRQITPDTPDVDHFDSVYLPNGKIAFASTASYQAMPCINGGAPMAQLYTIDNDGANIQQLTFEQDSDWTPSVRNDGRLLYLRWEYTDISHYFTRLLFHSNPDGTNQMEYLHSNSYFPNSYFYAKPVPGHDTQVVGIVSGHHGIPRSGRMLIFDPALGRAEAEGVVQEIPGRGKKVEALIKDDLVAGVWPHFIHPAPIADYADPKHPTQGGKYFLAAMKRDTGSLWGIYLADVFDNLTLIKEVEGAALLEPVPLHAVPRPPVIPDRIKPGEKEATVLVSSVYTGPGLVGVPKGAVKKLRVFAYHFNYNKTGGHDSVGIQSGWDIKRILGTVPVEEDGSASFRIPANTPVTVQPLDEKGRAIQLMRSWLLGRPGEIVSCVGCHDRQNSAPPAKPSLASRRAPSVIEPWYGPPRPLAFRTEIQPVLDRYCVACHDGRKASNGRDMPNFVSNADSTYFTDDRPYLALQLYVHRYGPENDYHLQKPMEYHTSTSPLFQMLDRGHHGVKLDAEAYDRLVTWADMNAPWRGSWGVKGVPGTVPEFRGMDQVKRRIELAKQYANVDTDPEREFAETLERVKAAAKPAPARPAPLPAAGPHPPIRNWPFDASAAARLQQSAGYTERQSFDLGNGVKLDLALVPGGSFPMGDPDGPADSRSWSVARIAKPFYIGRFEITNRQYRAFDPKHDSRYIDQQGKDHFTPGYPVNEPDQPVIRITWEQAMAFCKWASEKTGEKFSLPTEAQWEWAARAGSAGPYWFGDTVADFSPFANLADKSMTGFHSRYTGRFFAHMPYTESVNDGSMISAPAGKYKPNPWGLHDMHGNVAEWTLSTFRQYPYDSRDGRDDPNAPGPKVVRGGSWRDQPHRATASFRWRYEAYQPVWDVGFRVVVEPGARSAKR